MGNGAFVAPSVLFSIRVHPTHRLALKPRHIPQQTFMAAEPASAHLPSAEQHLRLFRRAIPDLSDPALYKGACGRVAVVGGCVEYTGAPYFAAAASLRGGGELAHVFCAEQAATPIKAYSPELVVHPGWRGLVDNAEQLLRASHAVVLGPGLGRSASAMDVVRAVVSAAVADQTEWPLVVDADALFMLSESGELRELLRKPLLTADMPRVCLTPNKRELQRLCAAVGVADAASLTRWFANGCGPRSASGRVFVLEKGACDVVHSFASGTAAHVAVSVEGAKKRCGGQGDVLSGITALFSAWARRHVRIAQRDERSSLPVDHIYAAAAVAAAVTVRDAGMRAFAHHGRAMVAGDMLAHLGPAFAELENGPHA